MMIDSRAALRIAIIVRDPAQLGAGEATLVERVRDDPRYELAMLVQSDRAGASPPLVVQLVLWFERTVMALRARSAPSNRAGVKTTATPIDTLRSDTAGADVDLVIDLGGAGACPVEPARFPHGVWTLSTFAPGAGVVEAFRNARVTRAILFEQKDLADPARAIAAGAYNTKFLAARNGPFVREKSIQLILHALARLHLHGTAGPGSGKVDAPAPARLADLPGYCVNVGIEIGKRLIKQVAGRLGARPGLWMLMTFKGSVFDFDTTSGTAIDPPGDVYWADPFIFIRQGETFVFYEEVEYRENKGRICVARLDHGRAEPLGVALCTDYHLSFPFVFEVDGTIFMIPETYQTKRIEVWRAGTFPLEWSLYGTALEGLICADSVVAKIRGVWWLFTNVTQDSYGDHCTELHVFKVDGPDLANPQPHPLNPVVIDSRTARGGGRVFEKGGRVYRFSQNNSGGNYGYGVNIMEIVHLDMTDYKERLVRAIEPTFDPSLAGCHHLDFVGDLIVMDVRKRIGRPACAPRLSMQPALQKG